MFLYDISNRPSDTPSPPLPSPPDPRALLDAGATGPDGDSNDLPPEELARRERTRENASGVVAYGTDRAVTVVSFALGGRMFVAGLVLYLRATRARDRVGTWVFWALIVFLLALYGSVIVGPPPPSVQTLILMGFGAWLMPLWAWWADRHREARG